MSYRADIEVKVEQILNTHYIDHHGNEYECKKVREESVLRGYTSFTPRVL